MHDIDAIQIVDEEIIGTAVVSALAQVVLGEALCFLFRELARLEQIILLLDDPHAGIHQGLECLLLLFHDVRAQIEHRISAQQQEPQQHAAEQNVKTRLECETAFSIHGCSLRLPKTQTSRSSPE
ncbi:hypothetical protein GALL_13380 [mine drainage metagenome]|uniref:Uncharacterized protein n=1 Tax=mine drainage metagenome TaxID=410659 RepID=A0A1J5TW46_9ZZZZ